MADHEKNIGQVEIEPIAKDIVYGQVVELVREPQRQVHGWTLMLIRCIEE
jgi:hypothetical protein